MVAERFPAALGRSKAERRYIQYTFNHNCLWRKICRKVSQSPAARRIVNIYCPYPVDNYSQKANCWIWKQSRNLILHCIVFFHFFFQLSHMSQKHYAEILQSKTCKERVQNHKHTSNFSRGWSQICCNAKAIYYLQIHIHWSHFIYTVYNPISQITI